MACYFMFLILEWEAWQIPSGLIPSEGKTSAYISSRERVGNVNCPSQETEVTSTPTRPVDNVVMSTKGLQDRSTNIIAGTTVENKGKLILTEIFPSVQKHDIF